MGAAKEKESCVGECDSDENGWCSCKESDKIMP